MRVKISLKKSNLINILIVLVILPFFTSALISHSINGHLAKQNSELIEEIDELTNDDAEEDITVTIDEDDQDRYTKEAANNCSILIKNNKEKETECPITWDSVMCWPSTPVNKTVYLTCANYINKFNQKNEAFKICLFNGSSNRPFWSLTNYTRCLQPSDEFVENLEESTIMEKHMGKIVYLQICGYVASMITLSLSIIILLRPKLRCPRNFIHINLFVAFAVRTILFIFLSDMLRRQRSTYPSVTNMTAKTDNDSHSEEFFEHVEGSNIGCKVLMSIYRYSGSVYHVAIFSEAFYLVLLLKFPYYNEKKGCKFSIITSWLMPSVWMIPWILVKAFDDNLWCWQTESDWNLLIKVPHSLLLVANITSAGFIIRILYSKMHRNLSREKLMKYRRLAKSILILIPIFGLHFIIFAWIPYGEIFNISPNIEIVTTYVETFFNAFQGFVVSFACCFIHREVRIEILLLVCLTLKKIKCIQSFRCMKFLDSDYICQLRYHYHENRNTSMTTLNSTHSTGKFRNQSQSLLPRNTSEIRIEDLQTKATNTPVPSSPSPSHKLISNNKSKVKRQISSPAVLTSMPSNDVLGRKICCCLFGNQKNEFHQSSFHSKRTNHAPVLHKNTPSLESNLNEIRSKTVRHDSIIESRLSSSNENQLIFSQGQQKINKSTNYKNKKKTKKVTLQTSDDQEVEHHRNEIRKVVFSLSKKDDELKTKPADDSAIKNEQNDLNSHYK